MQALDDTKLVDTVKQRIVTVVRYRLSPERGNNPSVLLNQCVPISLSRIEREGRDDDTLQQLLTGVVGTKVEVGGFTFTVATAVPGDIAHGAVLVTFAPAH